ncbi:MAG: hypothetical protein AAF939_04195 [Planctomycetota bacterium]
MNPELIFILNLASTWYMVGLIWMVQLVHYPLFAKVGKQDYETYQRLHQQLTSIAVGPAMLVEAFSSVLMGIYPIDGIPPSVIFSGIGLVFVIWISTAALQVPCHGKLNHGYDKPTHQFLVNSNWIRTIAWSARGVLVGWVAWKLITG